jgi:transglutaminase-like putative cysteine protease
MIYDVRHHTTYRYSQPVSISQHVLHLTPRACPHQTCVRSIIGVDPAPSIYSAGTDYFGNPATFVAVQDEHLELSILARSTVEVEAAPVPPADRTASWARIARAAGGAGDEEALYALQFAFDSPCTAFTADIRSYALVSFTPDRPILEAAFDLTGRIHAEFAYDGGATTVSTPVDEVFAIRRGVCQDFAHLELACLRALALPARYVSGYLLTRPPAGEDKLAGADASHAWLSVWCGENGWIDLDPTNNAIASTEHVTLAWGRDYGDVAPINGVIYGGGEHVVDVAVDVTPVPAPDATGGG